MRELTESEIDEVSGGGLIAGAIVGGVAAGVGAAYAGGSAFEVLGATVLGGASGFIGNVPGVLAAAGVRSAAGAGMLYGVSIAYGVGAAALTGRTFADDDEERGGS